MTAILSGPPEPVLQHGRRLRVFVPHASDCLTDTVPHGDGLVAFEFARRIAERGHTVHVASPRIEINGALPPTLHAHAMPVRGSLPRLRYMLAVRRLFLQLTASGGRFDIVHQLNPVFTGISLAFAGLDVPIVLGGFLADWPAEHARSGMRARIAGDIKTRIAGLQQDRAQALILTTPDARSRIRDVARNARKIAHIPHGIDPNVYRPLEGLAPNRPTILFLGGLENRKGIFTLLDAFPRIRHAVPDVRLLIGGAGGKRFLIERWLDEHEDARAVSFLGRVERTDVPHLMAGASVFAMPSFGEPFGMSLLEAMACGKPVVVTDAGGPREIVDERGGRRVPPGDAVALADALIDILRAPAKAAAMGAFNRQRAERVYGWDHVIDRLESVYRTVVPQAAG